MAVLIEELCLRLMVVLMIEAILLVFDAIIPVGIMHLVAAEVLEYECFGLIKGIAAFHLVAIHNSFA